MKSRSRLNQDKKPGREEPPMEVTLDGDLSLDEEIARRRLQGKEAKVFIDKYLAAEAKKRDGNSRS